MLIHRAQVASLYRLFRPETSLLVAGFFFQTNLVLLPTKYLIIIFFFKRDSREFFLSIITSLCAVIDGEKS